LKKKSDDAATILNGADHHRHHGACAFELVVFRRQLVEVTRAMLGVQIASTER
jgi:hypothetical protein